MIRKDYIMIAGVLRSVYDDSINDSEKLTTLAIAHNLAQKLKSYNPAFDSKKWFDAILAGYDNKIAAASKKGQ